MPFQSKQQKPYNKSRKPSSSSTNTRQTRSRKQKSHSRKQDLTIFQIQNTMNRSSTATSTKIDREQLTRKKQVIYQKYYKRQRQKQFPNISIIEEKSLILSNNQENSLDSLNNLMIQGIRHQSSVTQKSKEQCSSQQIVQEWTLLLKQYDRIVDKDISLTQQKEYFQSLYQLRRRKFNRSIKDQASLTIFNDCRKMKRVNKQMNSLRQLKKIKQIAENSSYGLLTTGQNQSYSQEKSSMSNEKSLQLRIRKQVAMKSQGILSKQIFQAQIRKQMQRKPQVIVSKQQFEPGISSARSKPRVPDTKRNELERQEGKLLQHQSEQQNKSITEQGQIPSVQFEQTQKGQQQFMKFMDKKYSEQNHPNLSLNNISNIMKTRPKQLHNKSIENENEIKEKEDDEVVAMLENQLRGKIIPEIPELEENQILKQSRDDLCLNQLEGEIQNNNHLSLIQQEQVSQQNKKFFLSLLARQKWIKSLQKDQKWKNAELALLSKMKKILHNPYIQFPEDAERQDIL